MVSSRPPVKHVSPSDLAVIVPVGGAAPAWRRCAQSLAHLDPTPGEIIVVIDGPNDDLAATAAGIGAKVIVLDAQGGPSRARNRGVQAATRDILLFVDSDVEVPRDLSARVADLLAAHPQLTAVIGSYDDNPGDRSFLSQYRNLLHHFVHQNGREEASTFWAGCGAVRRQAFREVGGFDERYARSSIEDIELGSRLLRSGFRIRLVKELQVKHLKKWGLGDMLATDLLRRAIPWTELMLREGKMVNDLNVKNRDRISVLMAFVPLVIVPVAWQWPFLLAVGAMALLLAVALNAGLFRFFRSRRGILFALSAAPFYWVYLLICGLGFGLGLIRHLLTRQRR
jgi:GT2 family glycosyltransferase